MPSSYSPPDVIVEQIRRTAIANLFPPQLPVVVVGPAVQIVVRSNAGRYDVGTAFDAALPGLAPGALVDPDTFEVVLDARTDNGKQIGLFRLSTSDPADAQLSLDGQRVLIQDAVALEYSILSLRNNNQIDSIIATDLATGVPDGIFFTDRRIDFLSLGASSTGDSFVTIQSPPSMVGRYVIYDMVPVGSHVRTVMIEKVDENDIPDLTKSFDLIGSSDDAAALASSRFIYGYPATHENSGLGDNNVVNGDISLGVGVDKLIQISTGVDSLDSTDIAALLAPDDLVLPDAGSGDAVWFEPAPPTVEGDNEGNNYTPWRGVLANLEVGDWMRATGDFGAGAIIRDFKITSIDLVNFRLLLENPDNSGSGSVTLTTGSPLATDIKFLRGLKGRNDVTNRAGDYLTGDALGVPFNVEVLDARPTFIEMVSVLPPISDSIDTTVKMVRGIPYRNAAAQFDVIKRITEGFTGNVLVSYHAARQDLPLNGLMEIHDQKSILDTLGTIHPANPIALMADMVTRSGLTDGNRVFYALCLPDNTLESYEAALDVLNTEEVYFVVPATQDLTVISIFKQHCEIQSQPLNKHERVVLASSSLITSDRQLPLLATDQYPIGSINALEDNEFTSNIVDWSLVNAGDVLKIMSGSDQESAIVVAEYRILHVNVGENKVTTLVNMDEELIGTVETPKQLFFRVDTFPFTKQQQAEDWRDYSASLQSFRTMMIRPDEIEIEYTDRTGTVARDLDVIVPMYYGCAVFAGLSSALPPQQPMTNVPIPGIVRLLHSNFYFTPDQLNTIAEGGNNIFVQTTRRAAPHSRHQLMTDMTSLLTREFSIIKLVDFSAKFIRNSLRPYVGNHNITAEFLTQLRGITEAILRALVSSGVLIQGTRLDTLFQDPDQPDTVIIEVSVLVPYPCNRIHVKLYL